MKQFTFGSTEKLKSRKLIEHLFSKGKSVSSSPLKVLYDFVDLQPEFLQTGVTTSSKRFKKAVQRNRIKRVVREAYRLQKTELKVNLTAKNRHLILFFIYIGKEMPDYSEVYEKMGIVLQRLNDIVINSSPDT